MYLGKHEGNYSGVYDMLNNNEKHAHSEINKNHKNFNSSYLFHEQTLIPIKVWVERILNDFILNRKSKGMGTMAKVTKVILVRLASE